MVAKRAAGLMALGLFFSQAALALPSEVSVRHLPAMSCESLDKEEQLAKGAIEALLKEGKLHAAYAHSLSLPGNKADAALLRADILRRLQRPEATAWYRGLLKTCRNGYAEHGLGLMAASAKNFSAAKAHFLRAVEIIPQDPVLRSDLGYVLILSGEDQAAAFELQVAHELDANLRLPVFNLLLLALLRGDIDQWSAREERFKPSAAELKSLLSTCDQVVAIRNPDTSSTGCPLLPQRASVADERFIKE